MNEEFGEIVEASILIEYVSDCSSFEQSADECLIQFILLHLRVLLVDNRHTSIRPCLALHSSRLSVFKIYRRIYERYRGHLACPLFLIRNYPLIESELLNSEANFVGNIYEKANNSDTLQGPTTFTLLNINQSIC